MAGPRTTAILAAMQREVLDREAVIEASNDVAEVTVTVQLQAGTTWVRATRYQEERVMRARNQVGGPR